MAEKPFDIQGHRGCRGLLPENSLVGFLYALELGVTTLEMDVVISGDSQVVVSHEPWMSPVICLDSTGLEIPPHREGDYNIFKMTYQQIRQFDCGSRGHSEYPQQKVTPCHKPLLREVIAKVEARADSLNIPAPIYNIEIKSQAAGDHRFHPPPQEFVPLVLQVVEETGIRNRMILQSFDRRVLQFAKRYDAQLTLALLVENELSTAENLKLLGFKPQIYSPEHLLVDQQSLDDLNEQGIRVIPWTINEIDDMKKFLDMGVQGIITDYPDRLLKLWGQPGE